MDAAFYALTDTLEFIEALEEAFPEIQGLLIQAKSSGAPGYSGTCGHPKLAYMTALSVKFTDKEMVKVRRGSGLPPRSAPTENYRESRQFGRN